MKNPAGKREAISKQNAENENTNHRIKQILTLLMQEGVHDVKSYSPSHQEILKIYEEGIYKSTAEVPDDIEKIRKNASPKSADIIKYKLWLKQGYVSPYTGKTIPLSGLFTTNYQIEHIIPQSRFFDNSLGNKIICESEVNQLKANQTAYEFITDHGNEVVDLGQGKSVRIFNLEKYEAHCSRYFKQNKSKLQKLFLEEIPEGFIKRQMNDSRYISKIVKGLLSNIVRENNEQAATSKNLIPVTGAITSQLKHDWGLNDIWNELIKPRFERLNEIKNTNEFGFIDSQKDKNGNHTGHKFFRLQVPPEIAKGFNKKRIDHRHHALDALVIACVTRDHTNYLNALNSERYNYGLVSKLRKVEHIKVKNKKTGTLETRNIAKEYLKPWNNFTKDAKDSLEATIISFKQNLRVINKTNNKTWQWVDENGKTKKQLVLQAGTNWAVRKPLHKETVSGSVTIRNRKTVSFDSTLLANLEKEALEEKFILVDKKLARKVKQLKTEGLNTKQVLKYFKSQKYKFCDVDIKKVEVYFYKKATASRLVLSEKFTKKQLGKVTDTGIQNILKEHLKNYINEKEEAKFKAAFSAEGIEELNKNIVALNNGKKHQPIYKVRIYEEGKKFRLGKKGINAEKYVETAKGTNLFFAIYENENKKNEVERVYETIPFKAVLDHQKKRAGLSKTERENTKMFPTNESKGKFLFILSPNDLVYVPTDEEIKDPNSVDFRKLNKMQVERVYKMGTCTRGECYFIPNRTATEIIKNENGTNSKSERMQQFFTGNDILDDKNKPIMIKSRCWKLKVNRLGEIIDINYGY